MKLYCRDNEIEGFHGDDDDYDGAVVHLCQNANDFNCEIRVVVVKRAQEEVLWRDECDNELCLDDCVLVRDDE